MINEVKPKTVEDYLKEGYFELKGKKFIDKHDIKSDCYNIPYWILKICNVDKERIFIDIMYTDSGFKCSDDITSHLYDPEVR